MSRKKAKTEPVAPSEPDIQVKIRFQNPYDDTITVYGSTFEDEPEINVFANGAELEMSEREALELVALMNRAIEFVQRNREVTL